MYLSWANTVANGIFTSKRPKKLNGTKVHQINRSAEYVHKNEELLTWLTIVSLVNWKWINIRSNVMILCRCKNFAHFGVTSCGAFWWVRVFIDAWQVNVSTIHLFILNDSLCVVHFFRSSFRCIYWFVLFSFKFDTRASKTMHTVDYVWEFSHGTQRRF